MNILQTSITALLPHRRRAICLANEAGAAADNKSITLFLPNQLTAPEAGTEHWVQLSPFGDFGNRTGSARVIQRFRKEDAENICNAFNSPVRRFTQPFGMPFYIGHPDHPRFKGQPGHTDTASKGRGKEMVVRHDPACADCQTFANAKGGDDAAPCQKHGLFVKVDWNEDGQHLLANQSFHGHSVNWSAIPDGRESGVQIYRPIKVKSTGFTNEPNIPVAPASLANAAASDDEETPAQVIVPPKLKLIAGFKEDEEVTMEQVIEALEKAHTGVAQAADAANAANAEEAQEALGFFTWLKAELAKGYDKLPDCLRYAVNSLLEYKENEGKLEKIMGEALGNVKEPLQTRAEGLCAALGSLLISNADEAIKDEDGKKSFLDIVHEMLGSDPASGKAGAIAALQEKIKKAGLVEKVKKAREASKAAFQKQDEAHEELQRHLSNAKTHLETETKAHATLAVDALVKAGKVVTKDRDARIEQLCNAGADQFDAKLAEFANGTTVIKTEPKSINLARPGAQVAQGEQHRRIRMEELMQQRERQFPNETYQERWNQVVTSEEGQGILDQMNLAKSAPGGDQPA